MSDREPVRLIVHERMVFTSTNTAWTGRAGVFEVGEEVVGRPCRYLPGCFNLRGVKPPNFECLSVPAARLRQMDGSVISALQSRSEPTRSRPVNARSREDLMLAPPPNPEPELDLDWIRDFISESRWRFARSMPEHPHEYTLRKNCDEETFIRFVEFIRSYGYDGNFFRMRLRYLDLDGYCYWTMGCVLEGTILINRAELKEDARVHPVVPNRTRFIPKPVKPSEIFVRE